MREPGLGEENTMTEEAFSRWLPSGDSKRVGNTVCGVYRGYPYTAAWRKSGGGTVFVTFQLEKKLSWGVMRALQKELPKGYSVRQPVQGRLLVSCSGPEESNNALRTMLDGVAEAMSNGGCTPPTRCPFCKKSDCDAVALTETGYVSVHRACVQRRAENTQNAAEVNEVSGNYITGILGALVGGLVGILPALLLIFLTDRIYSLLYALIPICTYLGYKLFRGKMNRAALVTTVVVSIFHLFTLEQLYFYGMVVRGLGFWPNLLDTIQLYLYYMTPGDIASDMAPSFLFLLAGLYIARKVISRTSTREIQDTSAMVESMTSHYPAGEGVR